MKNNFYITTSIAYANGEPHLGFAMESILADSINRAQKMFGKETRFLTGTDEHGIKIFKKAEELGMSAKELCDKNSEKFRNLKEKLNLSNDDFIRTADQERHWPGAQKIWEKLVEKGDIYKKHYEGQYCEGCEVFLPEKDLIEGKCQIHKKEPVKISEENYFFKLSKYSDQILDLLKSDKLKIIPSFRKNEIMKMLEGEGLQDVSFSRPKKSLLWGIPVPGDENHNMYVWCDALTNYISALGYAENSENFEKFWQNGEIVHSIGKDIVRFHAGIWIGMLLSAEIKVPENIHIHGFLTSNGEKMSKSIGNVVDPIEYVEKYGAERLRYFLLREVPTGRDADFTKEQFLNICNAHLSNGLGNLINRVAVMSKKNGVEKSGKITFEHFEKKITETWKNFEEKISMDFGNYDTQGALVEAWELVEFGNKQMDELKPWLVKKENEEKFVEIMQNFLELIKEIGKILQAFLPETSEKILKIYESGESEILFERVE
ncbi:methionine--tRNA ligase [Candidatus Gracilibacteria bacterium]|nr:methionine--tRNA ligase [Candidatus Gracilibacteria bacterium]